MRTKTKWIGALLVLASAAGLAWWIASPWWTLYRMREAAETRDAKALSAYIDYGALRRSTGRQLKREIGPLGGLAAGVAVRPQTVRLLFLAGVGPNGEAGAATEWSVIREGFDRFRAEPESGRGALTFRRDGLSWKLEAVEITKDPPKKR